MLCYRCGSHVADNVETCPTCGQKLAASGQRQATGTFSRRKASTNSVEGAPYKTGELIAERYLIKDVIGAGPLGHVFRAHDKQVDVDVALKVITARLVQTPEERKQFAKVLRSARKLSHPNLARVYEEGEDADRPYFSTQFLEGLTLRKIIDIRLQKDQFFALHEVEPILSQICAALDGAHKVGPHTDLKPDNVLVLPDLLKVTDFGLGLAMPRLPFVQAMKARKAERYLAPELVDGNEVDQRCDIYSVGVIFGEMLSGLTPDGTVPELSRRNPAVTAPVEGLYRKAINSNPNARFKTAGEFLAELQALAKKAGDDDSSTTRPMLEPVGSSPPPMRPRTSTGQLQMQRKPGPPIPEPPPPPPITGETLLPEVTQSTSAEALREALEGTAREADANEGREETDILDSGQFVASLDPEDNSATRRALDPVRGATPSDEPPPLRIWLYVVPLVIIGLAVGAALALYLKRLDAERRATIGTVAPSLNDAAAQKLAAEKLAAEKAAADKAAEDKAAADKLAAEKATASGAGDKGPPEGVTPPIDTAAADKAVSEKLAADKAAAEKAASEKLAAEKAAAEKNAADAAAAEKAAADKSAADKLAADKAAAAEKSAADTAAAAEKAAADKAALADKLAAEKAAAEKARAEKTSSEKAGDKSIKVASAATGPSSAKSATEGGCPEGMRAVAGGSFKMGTPAGDDMKGFDEKTLAPVEVASFCVDVFEYPNKKGVAPMVAVSWADAKRQCEGQGRRLCTEAEWEKACKGPGSAKWPYGNAFDANTCNTEDDVGDARSLAPAGRFAKCRSGYAVADLSGNAAEWTAEKIIKGGSFGSSDYAVRCSARKNGASFAKSSEVGFRCCADTE